MLTYNHVEKSSATKKLFCCFIISNENNQHSILLVISICVCLLF